MLQHATIVAQSHRMRKDDGTNEYIQLNHAMQVHIISHNANIAT